MPTRRCHRCGPRTSPSWWLKGFKSSNPRWLQQDVPGSQRSIVAVMKVALDLQPRRHMKQCTSIIEVLRWLATHTFHALHRANSAMCKRHFANVLARHLDRGGWLGVERVGREADRRFRHACGAKRIGPPWSRCFGFCCSAPSWGGPPSIPTSMMWFRRRTQTCCRHPSGG